jgi:hypothetical protein
MAAGRANELSSVELVRFSLALDKKDEHFIRNDPYFKTVKPSGNRYVYNRFAPEKTQQDSLQT